jgi:hypothetical protein
MHNTRLARLVAVIGALGVTAAAFTGSATAADKITVQRGATTSLSGPASAPATGTPNAPARELRGPKRLGSDPLRSDPLSTGPTVAGAAVGTAAPAAAKAKSTPELLLDWEGVNHRNQRLAFRGNQFSGEPPDQGLCVGNGFALETVNSALRIYNANTGAPASDVFALNEFYGFPPSIVRTPVLRFPGPFTFDISCHYDPDSNRWFHLAVDLDQEPVSGDFTGKNYLDLAVSNSGDPRGDWTVYRIPAINDGSEGTPDHNCAGGPCFGDFPHIGVDRNGVYITTNEFPLFEDGFVGAQVYAISKRHLVSLPSSIDVTLFNTADTPVHPGEPGFTVWPALSPGTQFSDEAGGTEYFVSSNAVFDDANADSNELIVWALTNTSSLNTGSPARTLRKQIIAVGRYAVPGNSDQKPGTIPLADCLNDRTLNVGLPTLGCWQLVLGEQGPMNPPPPTQVLGTIDSGDSRVLDVRYANGKLWAVLGTSAQVGTPPTTRVGVGWYILKPTSSSSGVSAKVDLQGILAATDENLIYPTVGVTTAGRGVLGFSIVSENTFPSVGYASIDAKAGVGPIGFVEAGKSPQDGFTEYPPVGGNRPRWGDYGAAAVDGKFVYLGGEYIQQGPCTLTQFIASGFTCSLTRTILANWSTRLSKLQP